MLDYRLIEAFAAVLQEGGFDRAARSLHLTQSAVSQRIKLLEDQLGLVLLVRSQPPRATPAGQHLIRHHRQVQQLEESLGHDLGPSGGVAFTSLAIGINADSLATWFLDAVHDFVKDESVVLDLSVEDQERTHRLLRDGEVTGCVSTRKDAMRGCRVDYLGCMEYRLLATPEFTAGWFPDGLNEKAVLLAPALLFTRGDDLHNKMLRLLLGRSPTDIPSHYVPSYETFIQFIVSGLGYGMVPDRQSAPLLTAGKLVNLAEGKDFPVDLYWHRWNIRSRILEGFSKSLIRNAREMLKG